MAAFDDKPKIDSTVAHVARRYNYWLGGKDNYAADRASGDRIAKAYPQVVVDARANRKWMHRVVRCLVAEHGVTQFLDVGVSLPVEPNVHQVAQGIDPAARVVYVDNDPLVMVHARALLTSTPEGATGYAEVDMHDTARMLAEAKDTLDFTRPVAVLFCAVLHFVDNDEQAYALVARTLESLPPGSYVAISNFTLDGVGLWRRWQIKRLMKKLPPDGQIRPRSRRQFTNFFSGLEIAAPGVRLVSDWRVDLAEPHERPAKRAYVYGAVAKKVALLPAAERSPPV
ncbi:SAM-dependent methyltransferase [Actinoplanes oblitus]|uniref:SAM-dependent methyltransferase n=1 Tax=Actinoplanes oblitus TaxID=3040509 RepID=A0ABY8WCZ1_9ACTN|nr:SAM-dependent methyltransferase [Actinoplanes oblitus]WIM95741.1 SAM-dependent methyltransferase [Actinoplanes oblitus]